MSSPPRALVTGASSGIGEAVARVLAIEGYRVALLARRKNELERVRLGLDLRQDENGSPASSEHVAIACDLTNPEEIDAAFARLRAEGFEGLELLVNNAGIGYRAKVEELDPATIRAVLDTNVTGLLLVCRQALPFLRRGKDPVVVNVSSVVGRRGIPGQTVYSASKAAVCSIGEALRIEWAEEEIAVSTLNPALTATGFFEAQANPAGLEHPDLSEASAAVDVARAILGLARHPVPERSLRWKWKVLGVLSILWPRFADRMLAKRLGPGWRPPTR